MSKKFNNFSDLDANLFGQPQEKREANKPQKRVKISLTSAEKQQMLDSQGNKKKPKTDHRIINLKLDHPTVAQAFTRLREVLLQYPRGCGRLLKVIHGYGSGGYGGKMGQLMPAQLADYQQMHLLSRFACGDEFPRQTEAARQLVQRHPYLKKDPDCRSGNPGITIVEI